MATNNAINQAGPIPYFSAYKSADSVGVTGDSTFFTIVCDTELVDNASNYDNGTGIFVAPYAGTYVFGYSVAFLSNAGGGTQVETYFYVNATGYIGNLLPTKTKIANFYGANTWITMQSILSITLIANDQVKVVICSDNGVKTDSVIGATGSNRPTIFCGYLIS